VTLFAGNISEMVGRAHIRVNQQKPVAQVAPGKMPDLRQLWFSPRQTAPLVTKNGIGEIGPDEERMTDVSQLAKRLRKRPSPYECHGHCENGRLQKYSPWRF